MNTVGDRRLGIKVCAYLRGPTVHFSLSSLDYSINQNFVPFFPVSSDC